LGALLLRGGGERRGGRGEGREVKWGGKGMGGA